MKNAFLENHIFTEYNLSITIIYKNISQKIQLFHWKSTLSPLQIMSKLEKFNYLCLIVG